jgi:hypothetical protein
MCFGLQLVVNLTMNPQTALEALILRLGDASICVG